MVFLGIVATYINVNVQPDCGSQHFSVLPPNTLDFQTRQDSKGFVRPRLK